MNGRCFSTISSRPMLGWNAVSMCEKIAIEPSAPPPLCTEAKSADLAERHYNELTDPKVP